MSMVQMRKFDPVPSGIYPAVFVEAIEIKGRFGLCFNFIFSISQDMGEVLKGTSVTGLVSRTLTSKSKLAKWLSAMGVDLAVDENFELDDLKGKEAAVEIEVNGEFSNIIDVKSIDTLKALGWEPQSTPTTQPQSTPTTQPQSTPTTQPQVEEDETILF